MLTERLVIVNCLRSCQLSGVLTISTLTSSVRDCGAAMRSVRHSGDRSLELSRISLT